MILHNPLLDTMRFESLTWPERGEFLDPDLALLNVSLARPTHETPSHYLQQGEAIMIHLIGLAHETQAFGSGEPETDAQRHYAYLLGSGASIPFPLLPFFPVLEEA